MAGRGGSWNNNRLNCRCAYRNNNAPGNRNNNIGFRVCVAPHIDPTLRAPRCHARPGGAGTLVLLAVLSADYGLRTAAQG